MNFMYLNDDTLIFLLFKNVVHWKRVNLLSDCLRDCWQEVCWIQVKVITEYLCKLLRSY